MKSHEIDYKVHGKDMQFVEIELDEDETVIGEAGAMMYMHEGIDYEAKMGDGSKPNASFFDKMVSVGKRVLTKESLFMTHYTNTRSGKSQVAFASPYPGKIITMDLKKLRGEVICQKDSFLCAAKGTSISIDFAKKIGVGFFGGEGFILQKLRGDGMAFVHACGAVTLKKLTNETLRIDSGCIVAFTKGIDYDIQMVKGLKSMFFGGEGMFLATLSGTGYVWVQSLPFSRLADRIIAASPQAGGNSSGESSPLGSIINMLGD
jgi:uncharacterized protein (TIGR00266 family)